MKPRNHLAPLGGQTALDKFYAGARKPGRPLVFLDFDDVICTNSPFGGYDVFSLDQQPDDLWERLWHPPAVSTLLEILEEFEPCVVLTTSWLRMMDRPGFETLFRRTGLGTVADSLHEAWEAPAESGGTRLMAIEKWLRSNFGGEHLVVLDDELSGTGLRGSRLDRIGCVVLCERDVGLHRGHLPTVRKALSTAGN